MSSSRPHRCDEFPAEYSLASCSPAELASASSASLMLQPTTPFVELISANGNRGVFQLSQLKGSLYALVYVGELAARSDDSTRQERSLFLGSRRIDSTSAWAGRKRTVGVRM